ncbi:N-acetylmuramic acid 6-phosphate etherase [Arthroderma uncinatum]|uniref:N-acetylmuramic acid 6-phosphate etherase n=1 Tax=Arthroderma uncinatum TaxID=74035 RepID=UPI00144A687B|nr:N-acetylmuramic acid 6-phosphate etherase [Arthroderma uncinatum]KAF3481691.1 N-acetylmuramic acid 6-phosphate etherase [Arthroderma uncinatum]
MMGSFIDLSTLQTEGLNPRTTNIDKVSTLELCRLINDEDATVPGAIVPCLPRIADAIDALAPRVSRGGRVVYVGAEIPPTFSAPSGQFVALMAGGDAAMRKAQEGAEDDDAAGSRDLEPLELDPDLDTLIGIAASGRTPYVLSCLEYAKKLGCITIGISCSAPSAMGASGLVDYMITPVTGPEMVDVKTSNLKLQQRSRNIIRKLSGSSCPSTDTEIDDLLCRCDGSVKLALATLALSSTPEYARRKLEASSGKLSAIMRADANPAHSLNAIGHSNSVHLSMAEPNDVPYSFVLYVDGGGTKCRAMIVRTHLERGVGEAGPCNVSDTSLDSAIAEIKLAVQRALDMFSPRGHEDDPRLSLDNVKFKAIWIGLAGYDRPQMRAQLDPALFSIFRLTKDGVFKISNDIQVLESGSDLLLGEVSSTSKPSVKIILVAGTGSVAVRYTRNKLTGEFIQDGKSGGWGHLLGDDGSGYDLGREAIRSTLYSLDNLRFSTNNQLSAEEAYKKLSPLSQRVLDHFGISKHMNDYDLGFDSYLEATSNATRGPGVWYSFEWWFIGK